MSADSNAVELKVSGRVQGVFFRAFVRDAARSRDVAGWAENRPDRTVLVRLEGDHDAISEVERACHEGPPRARVEAVERREVAPEGLTGFEIR